MRPDEERRDGTRSAVGNGTCVVSVRAVRNWKAAGRVLCGADVNVQVGGSAQNYVVFFVRMPFSVLNCHVQLDFNLSFCQRFRAVLLSNSETDFSRSYISLLRQAPVGLARRANAVGVFGWSDHSCFTGAV